MEISTLNSKNNFDFTSFLEKNRNESSNEESNTNGINAASFLEKTPMESEQLYNMYTKQKEKLDGILAMAMTGEDVSGLLDDASNTSALEAYDKTLDEIEEGIETKADEAMDDNETVTVQTSEDQVIADSENQTAADSEGQTTTNLDAQVVAGGEGSVDIETGSQDNTKEQVAGTEGTSDTRPEKPAKQSVSLYV